MSAGQMTASDRLHERIDHLEEEVDALKTEKAELVQALENCVVQMDFFWDSIKVDSSDEWPARDNARALLKKVKP